MRRARWSWRRFWHLEPHPPYLIHGHQVRGSENSSGEYTPERSCLHASLPLHLLQLDENSLYGIYLEEFPVKWNRLEWQIDACVSPKRKLSFPHAALPHSFQLDKARQLCVATWYVLLCSDIACLETAQKRFSCQDSAADLNTAICALKTQRFLRGLVVVDAPTYALFGRRACCS